MRRWILAVALVLMLGGGVSTLLSQNAATSGSATAADVGAAHGDVERGRYIVHRASLCIQCHSPRDREGNLLTDRLLEGGAIPVKSPFEGPRWAFMAPNIKRAPGYSEQEFVRLLTKGITRDGRTPRSPMPPFRFTEDDAKAVYAYLTSL